MQKSQAKLALFFVLFMVVADLLISTLVQAISLRDVPSMRDFNVNIALHLLSYMLTFGVAGALIAWMAAPLMRLPLSIGIGLTYTLLLLTIHKPQPWLAQSDETTAWFEILAWANWYMPTLSSTLGGAALTALRPRRTAHKISTH